MATKTISIDMVAYEKLRQARVRPGESFSQVIKRGHWKPPPSTGAALLRALEAAPIPSEGVIERLNIAQKADEPPEEPWID